MIDTLRAVRVPSGEEEALPDLVRARGRARRGDLMRARHRLGKMLLRYGIRFEDTTSRWGARHRSWLTELDLGGAADARLALRPSDRQAAMPARDRHALRGRARGRGRQLRSLAAREPADESYLGLVPFSPSTAPGPRAAKGTSLRPDQPHARRLLIEAAWHTAAHPGSGPRWSAAKTAIADRLGRSAATVNAYFYDPTGEKARAVKARYSGGVPTLRRVHAAPEREDHALHALQAAGRATVTQIATGGRPVQLWTAIS